MDRAPSRVIKDKSESIPEGEGSDLQKESVKRLDFEFVPDAELERIESQYITKDNAKKWAKLRQRLAGIVDKIKKDTNKELEHSKRMRDLLKYTPKQPMSTKETMAEHGYLEHGEKIRPDKETMELEKRFDVDDIDAERTKRIDQYLDYTNTLTNEELSAQMSHEDFQAYQDFILDGKPLPPNFLKKKKTNIKSSKLRQRLGNLQKIAWKWKKNPNTGKWEKINNYLDEDVSKKEHTHTPDERSQSHWDNYDKLISDGYSHDEALARSGLDHNIVRMNADEPEQLWEHGVATPSDLKKNPEHKGFKKVHTKNIVETNPEGKTQIVKPKHQTKMVEKPPIDNTNEVKDDRFDDSGNYIPKSKRSRKAKLKQRLAYLGVSPYTKEIDQLQKDWDSMEDSIFKTDYNCGLEENCGQSSDNILKKLEDYGLKTFNTARDDDNELLSDNYSGPGDAEQYLDFLDAYRENGTYIGPGSDRSSGHTRSDGTNIHEILKGTQPGGTGHSWVRLGDGTILDGSSGQFMGEKRVRPKIGPPNLKKDIKHRNRLRIIGPNDPLQKYYQPADLEDDRLQNSFYYGDTKPSSSDEIFERKAKLRQRIAAIREAPKIKDVEYYDDPPVDKAYYQRMYSSPRKWLEHASGGVSRKKQKVVTDAHSNPSGSSDRNINRLAIEDHLQWVDYPKNKDIREMTNKEKIDLSMTDNINYNGRGDELGGVEYYKRKLRRGQPIGEPSFTFGTPNTDPRFKRPNKTIDSEKRLVGHEGRHRARALMEEGVKKMPFKVVAYSGATAEEYLHGRKTLKGIKPERGAVKSDKDTRYPILGRYSKLRQRLALIKRKDEKTRKVWGYDDAPRDDPRDTDLCLDCGEFNESHYVDEDSDELRGHPFNPPGGPQDKAEREITKDWSISKLKEKRFEQ